MPTPEGEKVVIGLSSQYLYKNFQYYVMNFL